jgi:exodeoxyribonuclease V alpha subunit
MALISVFTSSDDAAVEPGPSSDFGADDARIYSRELYDVECLAAECLTQLLSVEAPLFEPRKLEHAMHRAEQDNHLVLEADQRRAIVTALSRQVSIISGGPGVGKTTSIRILVELLEQRGVPYMLLSPTGKAAKHLAEATSRNAYTIHRQLFSQEREKEQERRRSHRQSRSATSQELYLPADAIIVDEASMVDLPLLAWLLRSIGPHTRVIFVGDKDQLASVGPGSVLRDLIACGRIPVTLLTVIKRQGEGSPIVEAAHAINRGDMPAARFDSRRRPVHPQRPITHRGRWSARPATGRRKRRPTRRAGHLAAARLAGRRGRAECCTSGAAQSAGFCQT